MVEPGGFFPAAPAPAARLVTLGSRLKSSQWAKPTVVGASGSYMLTAKLAVPWGAPVHDRSGLTFCPPAIWWTAELGIVSPSLNWLLVTVKLCSPVAMAPPFVSIPRRSFPGAAGFQPASHGAG